MQSILELLHAPAFSRGLVTCALAAGLVAGRQAWMTWLRARDLPVQVRQRWQVTLRNAGLGLFVVGSVVIWAEQLQAVAVSLLALGAAIVLATKELITCVSGSFLRLAAGNVKLGDRIEIHGIRGDVIDIGALTTTLLEVGPGPSIHQATGRVLVIPNSFFLADTFANESLAGSYVFHTLVLPLAATADLLDVEHRLLRVANDVTRGFAEEAREAIGKLGNDRAIEVPTTDAKVWVRVVNADQLEVSLRFVAPSRLRGRLEQEILHRFLRGSAHGDDEPRTPHSPAPPG